ncbi:STELLO glycosyltransferase family protein [Patescibacteria group bacterium]
MKKYIVMTSINAPTKAVKKYANMKDWRVVMIGDKKTPSNWKHENIEYISPAKQKKLSYTLTKDLPWNLPSRVNIGYLYAMEQGADIITQSDDDNIPNRYWKIPNFDGNIQTIKYNGFVNIYKSFTKKFVWPRGFPLDKILESKKISEISKGSNVRIWQHLANKDTDVDAIYRLTNNTHINFSQRKPLALNKEALCPFNCQSTTFHKDVYVLLYLPSFITPRASDIVRGLIAQPLLWSIGYSLGFTSPIVTQERNPHDFMKDFKDELLIYLHSENIVKIAKKSISQKNTLSGNLLAVYKELVMSGLIPKKELVLLKSWIKDVENLS